MALHYEVIPTPHSCEGRWLVGYRIPGMPGCYTVTGDAPTEQAARSWVADLNVDETRKLVEELLAGAPQLALQPRRA